MLKIEHLDVWFGLPPDRVDAVKDAGFSVTAGESFGLVGESGSGKSTLLNILGILDSYDSGEYWLDGTLIKSLSEQ